MKPGEILLAIKKRGFGAGKWNGSGGKIKDGETIALATVRELKEEIGVAVKDTDLKPVARFNFYFPQRTDWDMQVFVFFAWKFAGEPSESDEMKPQWFKLNEIPFSEMWPDDMLWLPRALNNEKLIGDFWFSGDGETIDKHKIESVSEETLQQAIYEK